MKMEPTAQVGKNGITDTLIGQIDDQLEAREMIKVSVLQNAELDAKAVANDIAAETGAEVVQVLGFEITSLYSDKLSTMSYALLSFCPLSVRTKGYVSLLLSLYHLAVTKVCLDKVKTW